MKGADVSSLASKFTCTTVSQLPASPPRKKKLTKKAKILNRRQTFEVKQAIIRASRRKQNTVCIVYKVVKTFPQVARQLHTRNSLGNRNTGMTVRLKIKHIILLS